MPSHHLQASLPALRCFPAGGRRGRVDAAGVEYGGGGGGYNRQWEEYGGTRRTAGDTAGAEHRGLRLVRQRWDIRWAAALEDDTAGEGRNMEVLHVMAHGRRE